MKNIFYFLFAFAVCIKTKAQVLNNARELTQNQAKYLVFLELAFTPKYFARRDRTDRRYNRGGGTIIAWDWVLTSAHIFDDPIIGNRQYMFEFVTLIAGQKNTKGYNAKKKMEGGQVIMISREENLIKRHTHYGKVGYDVALIHLKNYKFYESSTVGLATLIPAEQTVAYDEQCSVMGWGKHQTQQKTDPQTGEQTQEL